MSFSLPFHLINGYKTPKNIGTIPPIMKVVRLKLMRYGRTIFKMKGMRQINNPNAIRGSSIVRLKFSRVIEASVRYLKLL